MNLELTLAIIGILLTWLGLLVAFQSKRVVKKVFAWVTTGLAALLCISFGVLIRSKTNPKQMVEAEKYATKGGDQSGSLSFIDEAEAKDRLKQAIRFEMLSIYEKPESFNEYKPKLSDYWLPIEQGGKSVEKIQNSVTNLLRHGWRYREDSRCDVFDVRSVHVSGSSIDVTTRESWYVPVINSTGDLVIERNPNQRWDITYKLRRVNGTWLIEDSNAPYAK